MQHHKSAKGAKSLLKFFPGFFMLFLYLTGNSNFRISNPTKGELLIISTDLDRGDVKVAALFVHGSGGNAEMWKPVLNHFKTVRRFAIELPGHSRS
jgi:hypothetical protein